MQIGTLIQVGDAWRLIEAPSVAEGQAEASSSSFFFQPATAGRPLAAAARPLNDDSPRLLAELEKLDQFDPRRPDLLEQIANLAKTPEERALWYRQMADTISAAVQSGKLPDGDKRLEALFHRLGKSERGRGLGRLRAFPPTYRPICPEPCKPRRPISTRFRATG